MAYLAVENGRQIYFEYYPGSKVPVMLIHGWGTTCRVWDTTLVALQDAGHAVISFDQRGCGLSDKDFSSVSVAEGGRDALAILQHLGLQRAVFNGWSLGGAIAVAAASGADTGCAGVVLTAAASPRYVQAPDFPHGNPPNSTAETLKLLRADRAAFLFELTKAVFAKPVHDATIQWMWGMFMQAAPSADSALAELDIVDQREALAALDCPVLSIVGGADVVVAPDICRLAAKIAKQSSIVEFPDSGHAPFLENGPQYRQALLQFLASLD
jgi:non-heme chloroperoxidase